MKAQSFIATILLMLTTVPLLAADTIKIGSEIKKTIGTLIEMQAGDVACYLTLKDDQNVEFREMAGFEICEQQNLINKRLTLRYDPVEILADVCQGNPDCEFSKLELLVTEVQVIDAKTEESAVTADDVGPDGLNSKELTVFLKALQSAVKTGKPADVAHYVSFPLRVNYNNGGHRNVTKAQFARAYNKIFTSKIKAALMAQQPAELFRSWRGAMVGDGELWFSGICAKQGCTKYEILVIAVNLPSITK